MRALLLAALLAAFCLGLSGCAAFDEAVGHEQTRHNWSATIVPSNERWNDWSATVVPEDDSW